jgi:hypothetical protein
MALCAADDYVTVPVRHAGSVVGGGEVPMTMEVHLWRFGPDGKVVSFQHVFDFAVHERAAAQRSAALTGRTLQVFADTFGIPSSRAVDGGGASLGSAMCAAAAVGIHPDIESASAAMAKDRESFSPDPASTAVYARMAETVYHDIRTHTDALFERAYPIFH